MNTRLSIKSLATTAIIVSVFSALAAQASPISIDFNVGTSAATHSNEPDNNAGLALPGQVGPWNAFTVAATAGAQSIPTAEGPTFTINPAGGGPGFAVYAQSGSALRGDIIAINDAVAGHTTVPWELTGLVPNGTYSLIFFQRIGYEGAYTTIDGVGAGTTESTEKEKDYDFEDVGADGTGKISGTFDTSGSGWHSWAGLQFQFQEVVIPEPASLVLLALGVAGLSLRRRRCG